MYVSGRAFTLTSLSFNDCTEEAPAASETAFHRSGLHSGYACMSALQVSKVSPLKEGNSSKAYHSIYSSKQRGMAAELADILSDLDDAARLADELDFGVKSRSLQSGLS